MKPTASRKTIHVDSGIKREYTMTVSSDARDSAYLLQTLTDLYSDKESAFIREISTNAWDSHVMAGQTRPIKITLPRAGMGNAKFIVQDWGVGLDTDGMVDTYTYGKSPKRDSNEATGMLGLGAKSPLTFCLSFTIVGIKDGVKTIGVVTKNELGVGVLKILDVIEFTPEQLADPEIDTDNGVTISIPVPPDKVDEVCKKANNIFRFWREGVLVDGRPPKPIEPLFTLDPDVYVMDTGWERVNQYGYHDQKSYVVQGNVAYPYKTEPGLPPTICWVPMGCVDFTPAREELQYSDLTNQSLSEIRQFIQDNVGKMIDYVLDSTPSRHEQLREIIRLKRALPQGFKHPRIPVYRVDIEVPDKTPLWRVDYDQTAYKALRISDSDICSDKITYIYGFPFKSVSPLHKTRISLADIEPPYILIPDKVKINLDGFPRRHWDSIPEVPKQQRLKLPKEIAPREQTVYKFFLAGIQTGFPTYDGELPVVFVDNNEPQAKEISSRFPLAVASIIVANQENRFKQLHPGAKALRDWIVPQIKSWERRLTKGDHKFLNSERWERNLSIQFCEVWREIKDKDLREHMNLYKSEHLEKLFWVNNHCGHFMYDASEDVRQKIWSIQRGYSYNETAMDDQLRERYPLIWSRSSYDPVEDLVVYVNAKYAQLKKMKKLSIDDNDSTDDTDGIAA